ncbi:hypothetical protein HDF10_002511 [Edaphobacter lichenicola]|uniref:Uncharacterized protein n=1 Tax=Tunturiibacter lichenicola TaxID=2051959 RepID=A0A7W8JAS2_9BACT|nr:hypothetical protein [Edaphobacter lichenicola]
MLQFVQIHISSLIPFFMALCALTFLVITLVVKQNHKHNRTISAPLKTLLYFWCGNLVFLAGFMIAVALLKT